MTECRRCAEEVDSAFRYCPWCAAPLRIKVTELFGGADGKALRVSRYFGDDEEERPSFHRRIASAAAPTSEKSPKSASGFSAASFSAGVGPVATAIDRAPIDRPHATS